MDKNDIKQTKEELEITELAGKIAGKFIMLEQTHPADLPDLIFHVHAIQNIIMARVAQRANPKDYATYTKEDRPDLYRIEPKPVFPNDPSRLSHEAGIEDLSKDSAR